jgi:hypothetical protein
MTSLSWVAFENGYKHINNKKSSTHLAIGVPDLAEWTGESRIQLVSLDSLSDPRREVISPGF